MYNREPTPVYSSEKAALREGALNCDLKGKWKSAGLWRGSHGEENHTQAEPASHQGIVAMGNTTMGGIGEHQCSWNVK